MTFLDFIREMIDNPLNNQGSFDLRMRQVVAKMDSLVALAEMPISASPKQWESALWAHHRQNGWMQSEGMPSTDMKIVIDLYEGSDGGESIIDLGEGQGVVIAGKVSQATRKAVERIAFENGTSISSVIERALYHYAMSDEAIPMDYRQPVAMQGVAPRPSPFGVIATARADAKMLVNGADDTGKLQGRKQTGLSQPRQSAAVQLLRHVGAIESNVFLHTLLMPRQDAQLLVDAVVLPESES